MVAGSGPVERLEFDLTQKIEAPSAQWGAKGWPFFLVLEGAKPHREYHSFAA